MVVGSNPVAVTSPSDFAPASSKEFLDIQATIECRFTLKRVRDMIKTYRYGICFNEGGTFSKGNITNGRNVLIFGVHENSLIHANNKANNIFVMGDGFVQGINDTPLYAEKIYSQNFTQPNKKFVLSLHYNENDSYLFINGKQELKFKAIQIQYL